MTVYKHLKKDKIMDDIFCDSNYNNGKINYYSEKLNSQKLFKVYNTSIKRVTQYLNAEIEYVKDNLTGREHVLELGAGYGRIIKELASSSASIRGIDISENNVALSKEYLSGVSNAHIEVMDVHNMTFKKHFDVVVCLQNGLSAMQISLDTIEKIFTSVAKGGRVYFSSYSEKFWNHRLEWFHEQASKGLLGEIDLEKTKDGLIVCKDGFKSTTYSYNDLDKIGKSSGHKYFIEEVDESSIFLVVML